MLLTALNCLNKSDEAEVVNSICLSSGHKQSLALLHNTGNLLVMVTNLVYTVTEEESNSHPNRRDRPSYTALRGTYRAWTSWSWLHLNAQKIPWTRRCGLHLVAFIFREDQLKLSQILPVPLKTRLWNINHCVCLWMLLPQLYQKQAPSATKMQFNGSGDRPACKTPLNPVNINESELAFGVDGQDQEWL